MGGRKKKGGERGRGEREGREGGVTRKSGREWGDEDGERVSERMWVMGDG